MWILALALWIAFMLLAPTVLGFALDRLWGTTPIAMAVGATIGIFASSVVVAWTITRRFHELAPPKEPDE